MELMMSTTKEEGAYPIETEVRAGIILVLILAVLALSSFGCKETPPPKPAASASSSAAATGSPGGEKGEWFWRDRLAIRPVPLPATNPSREAADLVASIFSRLDRETPATLEDEIAALAEKGEEAAVLLAGKILDPDDTARFLAAAALGRIDHPTATEPLLLAIRDSWAAVAGLATDGLLEGKEPWILPRLIKSIGPYPVDFNPHLIVRTKIAAGLIDYGNYSGIPFLLKVLKENTPAEEGDRQWDKTRRMAWEKEVALAALTRLAGDDFSYLIDGSRPAQAEAAMKFEAWWHASRTRLWNEAPSLDDPLLLSEIEEIVAALSPFQMRNKDGAQYMLRMLGPPVFPHLKSAIRNKDRYIAFHALDVISQIAPLAGSRAPAWGRELRKCLDDERSLIRSQACRAIGALGQGVAAADLSPLLEDGDPDVALSAAFALGRIGGPDARAILEKKLSSMEPGQLRIEISAALIRIDPGRENLLLEPLLSSDLFSQEWALQKVIDLTGNDFSFSLGGSIEERKPSVDGIAAALRDLKR